MQNFVALSCARVTKTGEEVKFLLADVQRVKRETDGLLTAYGGWMQKCIDQPKVRGGVYPAGEIGQVLLRLKEIAGLHETLIDAFVTLHRPRDNYPDMLLIDTLELLRPFVADVGKLFQAFMQEMIYSTERPKDWTVQKSVVILWKAQLACRSFFHVTGNIQRNYFAATQQVSGADRKAVNLYLDSSVMQEALQNGVDPAELRDPKNADLIQRLFTLSYQMNSPFTMQNREDLRAINVIMSIFEIELKTLKQLLFPMIKIHEYEFSRTTV
ncbi:hypothetical protein AGDE_13420 [Angomonas deanei]|uniref:Uncharacterized protein n=1 Tax=Angomonas deanei TaxID=59799 RepID=A0A7G2CC20_9TRYP|nr:hypothetical protein AGDE_13420 [Angomonas deanei]CAD2216273.1 hypothetical protein, conserved [Angomonas deanei]|eukprot:EPY22361.1 hypothetical protein AGDE_13420 [Angomonas deanei]